MARARDCGAGISARFMPRGTGSPPSPISPALEGRTARRADPSLARWICRGYPRDGRRLAEDRALRLWPFVGGPKLRGRLSSRLALGLTLVLTTVGVAALLAVLLNDSDAGRETDATTAAVSEPAPLPQRAPAGASPPAPSSSRPTAGPTALPSGPAAAAPGGPAPAVAAPGTQSAEPAPSAPPESVPPESVPSEAVPSEPVDGPALDEGPSDEAPPASLDSAPAGGASGSAAEGSDALAPPEAEGEASVVPATIRQGETALVRLSGVDAAGAALSVEGATWPMVQEEGAWLAYVPVPPLSRLGSYAIRIDLFDADGALIGTYVAPLQVVETGQEIEEIFLDPDTAALLAPELVAIDNRVRYEDHVAVSGARRWRDPWRSPLEGPLDGESSGNFGVLRSYNGAAPRDWHHGLDIAADAGARIAAPAAGLVVFAGELPVHGLGVILDHGAGVFSGYWHMSALAVDEGALVARGDTLGRVGQTGLSVGPHLHWEVIVHGRDVDPAQWLQAALHQ